MNQKGRDYVESVNSRFYTLHPLIQKNYLCTEIMLINKMRSLHIEKHFYELEGENNYRTIAIASIKEDFIKKYGI